jgi:hypothetical protein
VTCCEGFRVLAIGIGVRLHQAGIARQMPFGVITATVAPVEEARRGWEERGGLEVHEGISHEASIISYDDGWNVTLAGRNVTLALMRRP